MGYGVVLDFLNFKFLFTITGADIRILGWTILVFKRFLLKVKMLTNLQMKMIQKLLLISNIFQRLMPPSSGTARLQLVHKKQYIDYLTDHLKSQDIKIM